MIQRNDGKKIPGLVEDQMHVGNMPCEMEKQTLYQRIDQMIVPEPRLISEKQDKFAKPSYPLSKLDI